MTWLDQVVEDLKRDEGCRLEAYQDGVGVWTIGYGHTKGVSPGDTCSQAQADLWLDQDLWQARVDLDKNVPWFDFAPPQVCRGLTNMSFNLGWPRLSGFKAMLAAGTVGDWNKMGNEALDSKWAKQVGQRATRIADLFYDAGAGGHFNA